jgi:hypothetical protein
MEIQDLDLQGMTVKVTGELVAQGLVRASFYHEGTHSGRIVGALEVEDSDLFGSHTELRLRFLALHTKLGPQLLQDFLALRLGQERPDLGVFKENRSGFFYKFDSVTTNPPSFQKGEGKAPEGIAQRRAPRVSVRMPVNVIMGSEEHEGMTYNISATGLFVSSETVVPPMNSTIRVMYPIPMGPRTIQAVLTGRVMWAMESMTSRLGGGFGVHLSEVNDRSDGELWRNYVQRELVFAEEEREAQLELDEDS